VNMLGAILNHLLQRDGILEPVRHGFCKGKKGFGGRALQPSPLVKMVEATGGSLPGVFICIDGLEECLLEN